MAVRLTAVLLAVLLLVGCGDDGKEPAAASSASLTSCQVRLRVDTLLQDAVRPPYAGVATELDALRAPVWLRPKWARIVRMIETSEEQGVNPDDLADTASVDRALAALETYRHHLLTQSCDPAGLPDDFGCEKLRDCAEELVDGTGEDVAASSVPVRLEGSRWKVDSCTRVATSGFCSLVHGRTDANLWLGTTTDGRFIAWEVE